MQRVKFISIVVCLLAVLFVVNSANAQLELLGQGISTHGTYNLIYDTVQDITWYDFTNTPNRWKDQVAWADALSVTFGSNIYDDWRLPITFDQSCWSNCTNSEMGYLYYTELGLENMTYGETISNAGDFQDLQSVIYWSGTAHTDGYRAWVFDFSNGNQAPLNKVDSYECISNVYDCYRGIAVMSGRAIVPEPISSILFLTGGGVLGIRRFFKRKA